MLTYFGTQHFTCSCCSLGPFQAMASSGSPLSAATNLEASAGPRRAAPSGSGLIIDCHGHYTTEPQELLDWRKRQIAAIGDR